MSYQEFKQAYIECLLWSETDYDENGEGDDNFEGCEDELSDQALAAIDADCGAFWGYQACDNKNITDDRAEQAGHDFCLSRNGHGAGFWDGGWPPELDEILTQASKCYGTQGLMRGDDGLLYTHN
jgi:hypothetical protein